MKQVVQLTTEQWYALGKELHKEDPTLTPDWRTHAFRASVFGLVDANNPTHVLSVSAVYFSTKPKKNGWGKYINWYYAYTRPALRHRGLASQLQLHIEADAAAQGYHRVKSLVQSYGGVRLHMRLQHDMWGVNPKGEIIVDAPIADCYKFPTGIPVQARQNNLHPGLIDQPMLDAVLSQPPFDVPSTELNNLWLDHEIFPRSADECWFGKLFGQDTVAQY